MFLFMQQNNNGITPDVSARIALFRGWIKRMNWPDDRDIVIAGDDFAVTRVLRFEQLNSDLADLSADLGLGLDTAAMPHAKAAGVTSPPAAEYYDAATTAIVRAQMAWVFDRYGYANDPDS